MWRQRSHLGSDPEHTGDHLLTLLKHRVVQIGRDLFGLRFPAEHRGIEFLRSLDIGGDQLVPAKNAGLRHGGLVFAHGSGG